MSDIVYPINTALAEVPVNIVPVVLKADGTTVHADIAYNEAGMDLVWNFVTRAGAASQTAVTPTTGDDYDWAALGKGIYTIEIPASGGASINNNAAGYGWFSWSTTADVASRGPICEFSDALMYIEASWAAITTGTAQSGTASTIVLAAATNKADTWYDGATIFIVSGTGAGQARVITAWVQSTDTATVEPNWVTNPSSDSVYHIYPTAPAPTTNVPAVNVTKINSDATAASNLEKACDGTGYNLGNGSIVAASVTGAVGSVTGAVGSVTGAVGSVTGAVGSVTGAVGSVAGNVVGSVGSVAGNVVGSVGSVAGAVVGAVGSVAGNVVGSVGSLATQAKADVNAEVVDVLNTDTFAEPGQGAPGATITLAAKIGYMYKAWRNKVTQTATTYTLFADNTTTTDQKATVSDDATTFTKGEIGTGA